MAAENSAAQLFNHIGYMYSFDDEIICFNQVALVGVIYVRNIDDSNFARASPR